MGGGGGSVSPACPATGRPRLDLLPVKKAPADGLRPLTLFSITCTSTPSEQLIGPRKFGKLHPRTASLERLATPRTTKRKMNEKEGRVSCAKKGIITNEPPPNLEKSNTGQYFYSSTVSGAKDRDQGAMLCRTKPRDFRQSEVTHSTRIGSKFQPLSGLPSSAMMTSFVLHPPPLVWCFRLLEESSFGILAPSTDSCLISRFSPNCMVAFVTIFYSRREKLHHNDFEVSLFYRSPEISALPSDSTGPYISV